jgi:nitroreductase
MTVADRQTAYDIAPVFVERWSPRAFTGEEIPDSVLMAGFEAARWAPSGFNLQPWRFVYAKRGSARFPDFVALLAEFNRGWAQNASALIVIASQTHLVWNGKEIPASSHSFDAGAAWSNFAHQISLLGWHTHGIGGFDHTAARDSLKIPDTFAIETMVAVGRRGARESLPETLQAREFPSGRLSLESLIGEAFFPG